MKANGKTPLRQCVGCREMKSKKELLRVIRTPEGSIVVDTTGKKNGRGAYLCYSSACLERAVKNKGLARTLKAEIPEAVYAELKEAFERIE